MTHVTETLTCAHCGVQSSVTAGKRRMAELRREWWCRTCAIAWIGRTATAGESAR